MMENEDLGISGQESLYVDSRFTDYIQFQRVTLGSRAIQTPETGVNA